jgi:hypothetical protein
MVEVDESNLPLVLCTFDGPLTDAELDDFLRTIERIADSGQRIAYVMDATRGDWLSATQRRGLQAFMARRRGRTASYCVGMAFVMSRSITRVMLQAVLAVAPITVPHIVRARLDEAAGWAIERLIDAGLAPPGGPILPRWPLQRAG